MNTTPTPDAAVRTARPSDADAMGEVQAASWRQAFADVLPAQIVELFDPTSFATTWRTSLDKPPSPTYRGLVATAGEDIVGLAAIGPTETDGVGELLTMCVTPEARRSGHGSRLLNAAVDTLRANDFREVECWVPLTEEGTQQFLRDAGLAPDGAYRDRAITDSDTMREVRLTASIES